MGDPRISCQWERVLLHKICLPAKVASFCENIHLQYIFTRLSQYYKHFVSQYLVSNVFWIRPMAIGLQIGYRCIATTPCLSARDPSGSTFANPLPPRHPVTPPSHVLYPLSPFFSMAFVVWVSPQLFCMGTRSVFIAVPASIVNVLPSVHQLPPLLSFRPVSCPPNLCRRAGGQNHDSIVWSRFRRDYHRLSPCYSETSPRIWPRCG